MQLEEVDSWRNTCGVRSQLSVMNVTRIHDMAQKI